MSALDVPVVVGGAVTAIVAASSFWLSARAARVQHQATVKGVDAAAYDRARQLYESSIEMLQAETRRLETQVADLRAEVARMHEQAGQLQAEVGRVRTQAGHLRDEVSRLRNSNDALRRELAAFQEGIS